MLNAFRHHGWGHTLFEHEELILGPYRQLAITAAARTCIAQAAAAHYLCPMATQTLAQTLTTIAASGSTGDRLLVLACSLYGLCWLLSWLRPGWVRWPLVLGALVHFGAMSWRGVLIEAFPLTNKMESFSCAALALALVTGAACWPRRSYLVPMLSLTLVAILTALSFPLALHSPPPLMQTIWYPLHVPASFVAYGLFAAAASAALAWLFDRDALWLRRIDYLVLLGFGLWSVAMICGGIWGVVAWGAYFLWDPKVIWSVILWLHYGSMLHIRLTPSLAPRPWVRPLLAGLGLLWVLVAYVGTSFLFGRSSHAF